MTTLDLDFVRSQFPAFEQEGTADWAHLENAGGSYVPQQVIDLLVHFYTATKVQPGWDSGPSAAATLAMERAELLLPATVNAKVGEIHLGPSTSQNTYVLARALRAGLTDGDEVIVTNQDHEANIGAWRRLSETGLTVHEWSVDPETGMLDVDDLKPLLNGRTRIVAVTHCSNVAATVNPVREIADLVHEVGGVLVVDGVSYAPHAAVDVDALDCDFYLYSLYKTYGPHVGLLYTRPAQLDRVDNQGHYFNQPKRTARLTPAGPDHAAIAGSAGIVDYYNDVYRHHFVTEGTMTQAERIRQVYGLFAAHEQTLMTPLVEMLRSRDGVQVIGTQSDRHCDRAPTIGFVSTKATSASIYRELIAAGVACGHGNFYARRLVEAMGIDPDDGVVRLSMVHYNSVDEVDRALDVLDRVL